MKELVRMIKFCLVGGANTAVDFVFKGITQIWLEESLGLYWLIGSKLFVWKDKKDGE